MKKNDNRQVGALPIRYASEGIEVLLVTSRETGRWVIPKGWRSSRLTDWDAAKREAKQEAGARGKMWPDPIGSYAYLKRLPDGDRMIDVDVYLMLVDKLTEHWPEEPERKREWLPVDQAARCVREPGLKKLLAAITAGELTNAPRRSVKASPKRKGAKLSAALRKRRAH